MLARILHLVAEESQEPPGPYRPRPSSAGPERCLRQLVYHARGFEPAQFGGRALTTFDDGNWHEEIVADQLQKTSFVLHSRKMRVVTEVGEGEIDGILTDLLGVDRLWDNKSINHFGFERLMKLDFPIDYFSQQALYIRGLQKINPELLEGILLFKNKNQGAYVDVRYRYDHDTDTMTLLDCEHSSGKVIELNQVIPNITQDAVAKFALVEQHRAAGTLPDRPFLDQDEYPCAYCRWQKPCWQGWEAEHEALDEDVDLHDLADTVRYQRELGAEITAKSKERDQITTQIKLTMQDFGCKSGRAGEYVLEKKLHKKAVLNQEKLSPAAKAAATETTTYEQLHIKRIRQEE